MIKGTYKSFIHHEMVAKQRRYRGYRMTSSGGLVLVYIQCEPKKTHQNVF